MAGKTDRTAVQYAFKKLSGRANTSNIKSDAQEVIGSNIQAGTQTIFGQDIPLSASRTDYQLYSASNGGDATAEYVVFTVAAITGTTYDADSATGGGGDGSQSSGVHGYKLFLTGNYQDLSSNTKKGTYPFVNGQLVHWTLGKLQLIPPNFSQESPNPYILKIFEADSSDPHQIGDEIPLLDEVDWTFDYYNGILFLQDYDASKIPAFAKGFIYVGDYLSASLSNATGTPGGSNTQVQFNDGGSFGGDSGFTYNKSTDTMTVSNMSGSLTRLSDGKSFLVAGSNVTIASASNGQVSISAATGITELSQDTSPELGGQLVTGDNKIAFGTGNNTSEIDFTYNAGGNFTAIASVKSIDMFLDLNGGDSGQKFRIFNNLQPTSAHAAGTNTDTNAIFMVREEGNVFTKGYITSSLGFSGSLTRLTDGTSYLAAGSNVTITSASNGQVSIASAIGLTEISQDTSPELGGQLVTGDNKISYGTGDATSEIDLKYNGSTSHVAIASIRSIDLFLDSNLNSAGTDNFRIFNNLEPASSYAAGTNTNANAIFRVHETGNVLAKGYVTASLGFSGSLTRLTDGTSYIAAGPNVTIASASNGQVTISSTATATPGGSDTQLQFNSGSSFGGISGATTDGSAVTFGDSAILVGQDITHAGDTDTKITFGDDAIGFTAGGEQLLTIAEAGTDMVTVGDGGDVDFRVRTNNDDNTLYVVGSTDRVGIGLNGPATTLHLKDSDVAIRLQRENNSEASTIEFAGSAGNIGASIAHDVVGNDLVFDVFNGTTTEESLRLGGYASSENRQVIILSGSGMGAGAMQPRQAADIAFFVSGSVDSRGTAVKGTAVFGGDVAISGTLAVNLSDAAVGSQFVVTTDGKVGIGTSNPAVKLSVGGNMEVGEYINHKNDSDTFIRFQTDDIEIEVGGKPMIKMSEGATDQVLIMSGGAASSLDPKGFADTNFFVSGAIGSQGTQVAGTSVFGGDLVVSGALDAKQGIGTLKTATTVLHISASTAPSSGSVLVAKSSTEAAWQQAWIFNETPTGALNGSNKTFSLAAAPINGTDLMLYLNGLYMASGSALDYTLTGTIVNFVEAPLSGDVIRANYRPSQ